MFTEIIVRIDGKEHIIASFSLENNQVPQLLIGTLLQIAGKQVMKEEIKFSD